MKFIFLPTFLALFIFSCSSSAESEVSEEPKEAALQAGDSLIELAFEAHGGKQYENQPYHFDFRGNEYSFHFKGKSYSFTKRDTANGRITVDELTERGFERLQNGESISLTAAEEHKYSEALNSVVYFASLPYKLMDNAVFKKKGDDIFIRGKDYYAVAVSFSEDGGGKDFEDVFYYWINKNTLLIDYLAYQYATNGGGVRFRKAFNARRINGVTFQDYVNYEAPVGTELKDLPKLFEKNELKELSLILTEDVRIGK